MSRRLARELAFYVLFQSDLGQVPWHDAMERLMDEYELAAEDGAFFQELTGGAMTKLGEIDGLLLRYSQDWPLARMASTDRNLLRLAVYELLYRNDIPLEVTVNEAVELAKKFGDEDSGKFVNGVLGTVIREIRKMVEVPVKIDGGVDE
ncbi:MAG TPA: transcription antitermination factor NusB [Firmicutes bacterium]|jgi:N utilization substance protein B|nr:transcription antitermination factor NusB [Bacillota bacterium]HBR29585.1 transcription antitermination factor NusB [Bacillota bacterium]HBR35386.1 transcription antitermination factor NusB [Bacillota bacterium]